MMRLSKAVKILRQKIFAKQSKPVSGTFEFCKFTSLSPDFYRKGYNRIQTSKTKKNQSKSAFAIVHS